MSAYKPRRNDGFSLIELMIAMVISLLLLLAVIQLFSASKAAYRISEGMSRVQENGRFALDFLQRDVRMAGHFGCVNDQSHALATPDGITTTFTAAVSPLRFDVSIQGYEAVGTAPGGTLTLPATSASNAAGNWTGLAAATDVELATRGNRVPGSDILVLRFLAPEGVPATSISAGTHPTFTFSPSRWDVLRSGVQNPGIFGIADCMSATVFHASAVDSASGQINADATGLNQVGFQSVFTPGQATLYRAESLIYYVGRNGNGSTSLYKIRYEAAPGAAGGYGSPQEMVDGIENLQMLYGFDRETDAEKPPSGYIDTQSVALSGAAATPDGWRRLGSVQVGILAASDAAGAALPAEGHELNSLGLVINPPADGKMRSVYQSSIAVRNRLYGN